MGRFSLWRDVLVRPAWWWLVIAPEALLGAFTGIRDEFIKKEWQDKLRITEWEWWPTWWLWLMIGLVLTIFIILESAYRSVRNIQGQSEAVPDDKVISTIASLRSNMVPGADGQQVSLFQLFLGLANDLTEGITRWTLPYTVNELLGYARVNAQLASGVTARYYLTLDTQRQSLHHRDPDEHRIHIIISEMMLAEVVEKRHRPGLPDGEAMEDLPADIYLITDLGRRVVNQQRELDKEGFQHQ